MDCIAAVDRNWAIGKDGDQFIYIPEDLKRFKILTAGHPLIMGRKTLAALPGGRPLPGRRNLVLSASPDYQPKGAEVFHTLAALLATAPQDAFVIGGGSVYRALLPHCQRAYLTRLDAVWPADTWFPNLDEDVTWELDKAEPPQQHQGVAFQYVTYGRRA